MYEVTHNKGMTKACILFKHELALNTIETTAQRLPGTR